MTQANFMLYVWFFMACTNAQKRRDMTAAVGKVAARRDAITAVVREQAALRDSLYREAAV